MITPLLTTKHSVTTDYHGCVSTGYYPVRVEECSDECGARVLVSRPWITRSRAGNQGRRRRLARDSVLDSADSGRGGDFDPPHRDRASAVSRRDHVPRAPAHPIQRGDRAE